MLNMRIVTAGTVLLVIITIGDAAAQTATSTAPGRPIPLLQILTQPDKTKTKLHTKRISRKAGKAHLARAAAVVAPDTADAAPTDIAALLPVPDTAPALTQREPSELVIGGRTVQIVSADDANEIDLAADAQNSATTTTPAPTSIAAAEPAPVLVAAHTQQEASPVGSASWIAQVLAALGGAVAAASVAWFLLGSTPQRTYG